MVLLLEVEISGFWGVLFKVGKFWVPSIYKLNFFWILGIGYLLSWIAFGI